MNFNMNPPATNTAKYKTMLCKHFETSKGCAFKDKCQFAHGYGELVNSGMGGQMTAPSGKTGTPTATSMQDKKGPNLQNYKIVKCKYWEKDQTCRYGTLCTFAHGDNEIRTKTDNLILNQTQMGLYDQGMNFQPGQMPNFDPNFLFNPYAMGFDPNMMNPNFMMQFPPQNFDPNMIPPNMMGLNPQMGNMGKETNNTNGNTNI